MDHKCVLNPSITSVYCLPSIFGLVHSSSHLTRPNSSPSLASVMLNNRPKRFTLAFLALCKIVLPLQSHCTLTSHFFFLLAPLIWVHWLGCLLRSPVPMVPFHKAWFSHLTHRYLTLLKCQFLRVTFSEEPNRALTWPSLSHRLVFHIFFPLLKSPLYLFVCFLMLRLTLYNSKRATTSIFFAKCL